MNRRVLVVDDDPHVFSALGRLLHQRSFSLVGARSAAEALQTLDRATAPFAVVLVDQHMPGLDGISLLVEIKRRSPHSSRLMLTGKGDLATAMEAVNSGNVFRFLTKPCPPQLLIAALEAGIEQYRLCTAEQELLQGTVDGVIRLLTELLAGVTPAVFGRALALRERAKQVADVLKLANTWELETAAMLAPLSLVIVPPALVERYRLGLLSDDEADQFNDLPRLGHDLLAHIPRLERVAEIVYFRDKFFDGSGPPLEKRVAGEALPLESRILKVLGDLDHAEARGQYREVTLAHMAKKSALYDQIVVEAVTTAFSMKQNDFVPVLTLLPCELQPGYTLMADVEAIDGRLLVAAGQHLTDTMIQQLAHHARFSRLREARIRVQCTPNPTPLALPPL